MSPLLESVYNNSGKNVHVDIGSKSFNIDNGASQQINILLTIDEYTKIFNIGHEDQEFLLKYDVPNIKINDCLGKKNGVEDVAVQLGPTKIFRLSILKDEMNIICDGKFLGIYQTDETIKFYASVAVFHKSQGGVIVQGGNTVEDDGAEVPDE